MNSRFPIRFTRHFAITVLLERQNLPDIGTVQSALSEEEITNS